MAAANDYTSLRAEDRVTENTIERNFKAFRPYLEKNVKAIGLIAYYDLFSTGTFIYYKNSFFS